jgi:hypothetical protein
MFSEDIKKAMTEKNRQPRRSGNIKKKRDGVFLVSIFLGRDANGKRRYVAKQIKGTKKDAPFWTP